MQSCWVSHNYYAGYPHVFLEVGRSQGGRPAAQNEVRYYLLPDSPSSCGSQCCREVTCPLYVLTGSRQPQIANHFVKFKTKSVCKQEKSRPRNTFPRNSTIAGFPQPVPPLSVSWVRETARRPVSPQGCWQVVC